MKDGIGMFLIIVGSVLLAIGFVAMLIALSGLFYWGIGAFIIWVFGIDFVWTFLHGVAVALIVSILTGIFGGRKREK